MLKIDHIRVAAIVLPIGVALLSATSSFAAVFSSLGSVAGPSQGEPSFVTIAGRSHTTMSNGNCGRNTGVPTSQLNLRDRCDVIEFWARQDRSF